ncbi:MAG TPA: NAD(+) synthase [Bacillota bacterium]
MPNPLVTADLARWTEQTVAWLRRQVDEAGARGTVFGLSGGVDSAVAAALCRQALGPNCLALIMPCESDPADAEDAALVAETFDIPVRTVDLTPAYRSLLGTLPADADPGRLAMARANLKPRLRMVTLYYHANALGYLVVGTGNRSELEVGYFTKHGDGAVDLLPLGGLLKREVWALARHLGVPERVVTRAPTAGLWTGQTDEGELGLTYETIDRILAGEGGGAEAVTRVESLRRAAAHKRALPPVAPGLTP